jgi:hypothetical protein
VLAEQPVRHHVPEDEPDIQYLGSSVRTAQRAQLS